jgi:hypothetical protein
MMPEDLFEALGSGFYHGPKTYKETGVRKRFREAFAAELVENPNVAPGPAALARRMGWKNRNLNGATTTLRRQLLREAGFGFNERFNRWVK